MVECNAHENDLAVSFEEKELSVRPHMVGMKPLSLDK